MMAAYENCGLGSGPEESRMGRGIPFGPHAESQSGRAIIGGSQSNVGRTARQCIGPTTAPHVHKRYLEKS
jgi:hypothetical protein